MATLPTPGGDHNTWGAELNEWALTGHEGDGSIKGRINVQAEAGCDPTGATDAPSKAANRAAWQAALDKAAIAGAHANANGRFVVDVPNGRYRFDAPLIPRQGVSIEGGGGHFSGNEGGTELLFDSGIDAFQIPDQIAFVGNGPYAFRTLKINGARRVWSSLSISTHVTIDRCIVVPTEAGIYIEGSAERWRVRDLYVSGGSYGLRKANVAHGSYGNYIDKMSFLDCVFAGQSVNNIRLEALTSGTCTFINPIFNTAGEHGAYIDGGFRQLVFINPNTEGAGQNSGGVGSARHTTGSITTGTATLTVADRTGYADGDPICVQGAGTAKRDLQTTVLSGGGTVGAGVLTLATNALTTVPATAKVTRALYDDFHFNNAVATPAAVSFFGGIIAGEGTGGALRYAIHAEKLASLFIVGTSGAHNDVPIYNPARKVFGTAIAVGIREPGALSYNRITDPFNLADTLTQAAQQVPGTYEMMPRTSIVSPPGGDIELVLLGNAGSFGEVVVRTDDGSRLTRFRMSGVGRLTTMRAESTAGLMLGQSGTPILQYRTGTVSIDPGSIAAGSTGTVAVTITGVATGDRVILEPPNALAAGLVYGGAEVTAADTVTVRLGNVTAGAIDDTARTWKYTWIDIT